MKNKVFVTRMMPPLGLSLLRERCQVEIWPEETPPSKEVLLEKVKGIDGLLCMLTDPVDAEVIAAGARLKGISTYAVGFDNIDVAAATARGIPVGHTPGVLTDATADLAFALLISAARRIVEGAAYAQDGHWKTWSPTLLLGHDLVGTTLGILGLGRIGRAMARRARGFDMKIIYHSRSRHEEAEREGATYVTADELLSQSDYLSLHAPLTDATRGFIDQGALVKMKNSAILINTARGPLVDHDALYTALQEGQISYAALDVTDPEPLPATHPLYQLPNCLIVPHLGSASIATRDRMSQMAADNLLSALSGKHPTHCVNPEVALPAGSISNKTSSG